MLSSQNDHFCTVVLYIKCASPKLKGLNRAALTLRNLLAVPSNWDIPRIITVVEYLLDAGAVPPFGLNRETDLRTLQGNGSETAMLLHMIFDPELDLMSGQFFG